MTDGGVRDLTSMPCTIVEKVQWQIVITHGPCCPHIHQQVHKETKTLKHIPVPVLVRYHSVCIGNTTLVCNTFCQNEPYIISCILPIFFYGVKIGLCRLNHSGVRMLEEEVDSPTSGKRILGTSTEC